MASYFWVGGSGTWGATNTKFATSSGGVPGTATPTAADNVTVDNNSGSPTITLATSVTQTCFALNITATNCTITGLSAGLNLNSLNISSTALNWTATTPVTFLGGGSMTTALRTISSPIIFSTGTTSLTGPFNTSSSATLTGGIITLSNNTLSCSGFSSNVTSTRAINFSTAGVIKTGVGGIVINGTNFSYSGTSNFNQSTNGTVTLTTGFTAANAQSINFTSSVVSVTETNNNIYNNFISTLYGGTIANNTRTIYGNFTIGVSTTLTSGSNVTTFAATSGTQTFTTNAKTVNFPVTFGTGTGTTTFAISGAITQSAGTAFTFKNGTLQFSASTTNTVGDFITSGTTLKSLTSSVSGTRATLSQASGTVNASYLSVKDSAATGGATWNALTTSNNTDAGNNTGWIFSTFSPVPQFFQLF